MIIKNYLNCIVGNCAVHAYNQECKKLYIAQAFSESFNKNGSKTISHCHNDIDERMFD